MPRRSKPKSTTLAGFKLRNQLKKDPHCFFILKINGTFHLVRSNALVQHLTKEFTTTGEIAANLLQSNGKSIFETVSTTMYVVFLFLFLFLVNNFHLIFYLTPFFSPGMLLWKLVFKIWYTQDGTKICQIGFRTCWKKS
jgi:hypothetical protein